MELLQRSTVEVLMDPPESTQPCILCFYVATVRNTQLIVPEDTHAPGYLLFYLLKIMDKL
jgi:hypothetical protein